MKKTLNRFQNAFQILIDIRIPESDYLETIRNQMCVSLPITRQYGLICVLSAVDLDNKARTKTGEVNDKLIDRNLAPKVMANRS